MDELKFKEIDLGALVLELIKTFGPWGLGALLLLGLLVWFMRSRGWLVTPGESKFKDLESSIGTLSSIFQDSNITLSSQVENNASVLLSVVTKMTERVHSHLTPDQVLIVVKLAMDVLQARIVKVTVDVFKDFSDGDDQAEVKRILTARCKAVVNEIDSDLDRLPDMGGALIPTERKLETLDGYYDPIVAVLNKYKDEREVAKQVKSMISSLIVNKWRQN